MISWTIPSDYFSDTSHMNAQGRISFFSGYGTDHCAGGWEIMQFYSVEFAVFFIVAMVVLIALKKLKFQHVFLLAADYVFYWTTSDIFLVILILISLITFYAGEAIYKAENARAEKDHFYYCTRYNMSFLGFFKYYNFGIENFNSLLSFLNIDTRFSSLSIFLPIGLSFYTFSRYQLYF